MSKKTNRIKKRVAEAKSGAAVRVHPLVRRLSKRREAARLGNLLFQSLKPRYTDRERLDWLERTTCSIGYNVEVGEWGVDFDAPFAPTIRAAIDAAMAIA